MVKTTKKVEGKKHKAIQTVPDSRGRFLLPVLAAFSIMPEPFCFLVPLQNAKN